MNLLKTKLYWLVLCLQLLAWRPAVAAIIPWQDGEKLTYEVYWGVVLAAEGTFTADADESEWEFSLDLESRGIVEKMVRIRDKVISTVSLDPWTSKSYYADREEGSRHYAYESTLWVGAKENEGVFINYMASNESKAFDLPEQSIEDFVSMLYHFRWHNWDRQPSFDFNVYDCWVVHLGRVSLLRMADLTDAAGQKRRCYVIEAKEVKDDKVIDKYSLQMWIPKDQQRIPLLARLEFEYGTFTIKLKKIE